MSELSELWMPLRFTGFAAWLVSCALAVGVLVRATRADRGRLAWLAATYLVAG